MLPKIDFRCPANLHAAILAAAAKDGVSPGEWTRALCAEKLGITIDVKRGMGSADEHTRKRVEKARLKGFKKSIKAKARKG